jgi:metal-responsive CopG/Arc/MetJ family transcriptional regulator
VSIPDDVFVAAERLARRSRKTRSRLFSDALREYVARRTPNKITESMDEALAEIGNVRDAFVTTAARRRLEQVEW